MIERCYNVTEADEFEDISVIETTLIEMILNATNETDMGKKNELIVEALECGKALLDYIEVTDETE